MDHGDMDPGHDMCNMNMLFTWSTENLCIVFRWWHIRSTLSLLLSLFAIILLGAGYEAVRDLSRRYELYAAEKLSNMPQVRLDETGEVDLRGAGAGRERERAESVMRIVKAVLYAVQVFYSFFIMLLFMTYNGWVMLAVAVGAFVGYLSFGHGTATKTVACH